MATEMNMSTEMGMSKEMGMSGKVSTMEENKSLPTKHTVQTPSGQISYTEQGSGPVALFVHGVLLNGYLWRHQLEDLSDIRRNIAVDLLAHGDTEISPEQDVSVTANAKMLKQFLDASEAAEEVTIGSQELFEHYRDSLSRQMAA